MLTQEVTKGWKKLVAKLSKQKGVKNPEALAAWIMRSKKGGESMRNIPANLIESALSGADIRKLVTELHDPYDEGEFQEGLRKVGEMLVKCCRSLDDLRTMIGLPGENSKQLDDATAKCSEAVKSVKVMLHDSMNPEPTNPDPATADAPKPDLEDDEPDADGDRPDVYKPAAVPTESSRRSRKRKMESMIESIVQGADPQMLVKHLDEDLGLITDKKQGFKVVATSDMRSSKGNVPKGTKGVVQGPVPGKDWMRRIKFDNGVTLEIGDNGARDLDPA